MRIIAGRLKGRRLDTPRWQGLRPTSDRLRETLFNVLAARVEGARVLDGYAGTGAVGIEAISRGAAEVVFVERDPRAAALVAGNLRRCGVTDGYAIIRADLTRLNEPGGPGRFDLILLDPPYAGVDPESSVSCAARWLAPGGLLVLEHARRHPSPPFAGGLERARVVQSGDSSLSFYRHGGADAPVTGAGRPRVDDDTDTSGEAS
jgi:16S rRNA (guanine966-N2)-methyltransferase